MGKARPTKKSRRNRLLAVIHIEKDKQGISDEAYGDILRLNFGVESAADLTDRDLTSLIRHMKRKAQYPQVEALKKKAGPLLRDGIERGLVRSERGLVRAICGVDRLEWCGEAVRLKKLLAVLEDLDQKETQGETHASG